ncbi:MAG: IclR family transcriptional regulator [Vibrionaceae bacterium]|nr:IclR family transcriptional regulator [Vibrionaceae bacterium]
MAERREKGSSITRVLEIIEAVACADHPLSPADISEILDIPKPSVHRLLQQLQSSGYLQTNMRGNILPDARLHRISLGVLYSNRYKSVRQTILQKLSTEIGETCGIAIPDGIEMIYYDRHQSNWPLQINLPVGSRTPIWCTASGKLYLSTLSESRLTKVVDNLPLEKLARNTIDSPSKLKASLYEIRENGFGVDNEEFIDGMVACSVPIKDQDGRLLACLFTHAPVIRKNLDELIQYIPNMKIAAKSLGEFVTEE